MGVFPVPGTLATVARHMPGISRDKDRAARQLAGLAKANPLLAAKLERGELPGYKGPLEGTEHLHPDAPPAPPPPVTSGEPVPGTVPGSAGHVPGTPAVPASAGHEPGTALEVGHYDPAPAHGPAHQDEPEPEPVEPAGPDASAGEPAARRGPLGQLADGFLGRI